MSESAVRVLEYWKKIEAHRLAHNAKGKDFRDGVISPFEWTTFKRQWLTESVVLERTLAMAKKKLRESTRFQLPEITSTFRDLTEIQLPAYVITDEDTVEFLMALKHKILIDVEDDPPVFFVVTDRIKEIKSRTKVS